MSKRAEEKAYNYAKKNGTLGYDYNQIYDAAKNGYEQAENETIDCACNWLFSHLPILVDYYNEDIHEKIDRSEFIKLFRTKMEE